LNHRAILVFSARFDIPPLCDRYRYAANAVTASPYLCNRRSIDARCTQQTPWKLKLMVDW